MARTLPQRRRRVREAKRAIEAMQLREQGLTYREVAAKLGIHSPATVYNMVMRELAKEMSPAVEELRSYESARIDGLIEQYLESAIGGDLSAAHFVLKAIAQRAKLHGLEITTTQGETKHSGEVVVRIIEEAGWRGRTAYDDSSAEPA